MKKNDHRSQYFLLLILLLFFLAGCQRDASSNEQSSSTISSIESSIEDESSESVESKETTDPENNSDDRAQVILEDLSLDEKVGQMFLARLPDEDAVYLAQQYHLGGYIWFAKDFSEKMPETVVEEIQAIQNTMPIDLFMAVDEEGGEVTRVSSFEQYRSEPFLSPQEAFVWDGWEEIRAQEQEKALLLKELGLNMNLAPVADVPLEETDFIYRRAFSTDPNEVAEFVKTAVKLSQDEKVASVIKHFPGYGNNIDTHTGIAYDERDFQTFIERDFLPFQAGIEAGASAVLVAHNVITSVDETMPASLSPEVNQLLRENLSFDGIVMTDDLIMDGLRLFAETEEAAVLAVLAGNDILISSEFPAQVSAVISAVEEGRIAEEQINEAVLRILKIKLQLEIIE